MNDAAFGVVAGQRSDAALRQTIRDRVEAAGTSFYWAMRLLPKHRRNGMYAVYAFCREVDDIADDDRPIEHKIADLAAWCAEIEALYAGQPRHLVARALREPVLRYRLRREDFLAVICNFTPVPRSSYRVGVPRPGVYREIFNTDAAMFGGSNLGNGGQITADPIACHGRPASLRITLPPLGVLILKPQADL